ncbi:MAG TPA: hypothetical protein VNA25_04550, partial [Phycisphaerae bacterium]|nr:hypothetical protein [Phycisphaerae bacterium]
RQKMREARTSDDKEQAQKAREQMTKLTADRAKLNENVTKQLSEVLTKEQMEKVNQFLAPRGRQGNQPWMQVMGALRRLELTEEQQKKVEALRKEATEAARKAENPQARQKVMTDMVEKIKTDVLTAEQRKKLEEIIKQQPRRGAGLPRFLEQLNLSDEQKAKAKAIWDEALKKAGEGNREDRGKAMQEAMKKISEEVLTAEQREQMKKAREGQRPARRPRGQGGGNRPAE